MTRVHIVEDEINLAEPLEVLLRCDGFDTVLAGDGPTALDELAEHGADLVTLCFVLLGISGTEVATG